MKVVFYHNPILLFYITTQFSPLKNENFDLRASHTFAQFRTAFHKIKKLIRWLVSEIMGFWNRIISWYRLWKSLILR